jgi:hypothetical protein
MNTILTRNYDTLLAEVKAHIAADAIVRGSYWKPSDNEVGGTGCFISCLTHSDDPAPAFERFGLTEPLLRIAESIFEALPIAEATAFFAALPAAVACDGKDLSRVHWHFLAAELRALPAQTDDVKAAIDRVTVGMDLLAKGQECPDAADAADAAYAAYAAANVAANVAADAAYAAYAAANVAYAAYAAAFAVHASSAFPIQRQRDTLLQLIADAPVVEVAA